MTPYDSDPADRLVGAVADDAEQAVEAALRPKLLDEFIGQERVREQLSLVLRAARKRGAAPDHVLLSGPPGLGKTTLSMIIAAELNAPIRITSGPPSSTPATWRRSSPRSPRAKCSSSTRSTGCRGPPRRCSTWRWRTTGSM